MYLTFMSVKYYFYWTQNKFTQITPKIKSVLIIFEADYLFQLEISELCFTFCRDFV
jgi:hypothetical protein